MTFIYRTLSFFINVFSVFFALSLIILLPIALSTPAMLLPVFMLVAVVLYSWFSTQFRHKVMQRHQQVKHSLRDWVRVNGFVALFFCGLNVSSVIAMLRNPELVMSALKEMMKQYPAQMQQDIPQSSLNTVAYIMLAYFISLSIHVLWTFALLKKHESFFEKWFLFIACITNYLEFTEQK